MAYVGKNPQPKFLGQVDDLTVAGDATVAGNVVVTGTVDGRDVATDGTKLDGIEASATADQSAAEIRTLVESATDSNVFTDADHTKLNGIEASATADQSAAEILTALLTVDGTGTTLDADLLDGQHGSYYTGYTDTAITNLVDSAPGALNTLNELAAALGDDVNFSTTVTNSIATKLPLAGGTLSGALDVTGTVTSDGLTVDGVSTLNNHVKIANGYSLGWGDITTRITGNASTDLMQHYTAGVQRMRIAANGDISFYEDTGTTAKFFWDASAESLGIGVTPAFASGGGLHVHDSTVGRIHLTGGSSGTAAEDGFQLAHINVDSYVWNYEAGPLIFATNATERMRITSDGALRVGANRTSTITGLSTTGYIMASGGAGGEVVAMRTDDAVAAGDFCGAFVIGNEDLSNTEDHYCGMWAKSIGVFGHMDLHFAAGLDGYETDTPQMTLDSSGNLLHGSDMTSLSSSNEGVILGNGTGLYSTRDGGIAIYVKRLNSDGAVINIAKDTTSVGRIGTNGSAPYFATAVGSTLCGIKAQGGSTPRILPTDGDGAASNGVTNLGGSTERFKDLYLSGGAYIGGTGAANKLDDYEEGTWTPAQGGVWNFNGATLSSATGTYTKIGRLVTIRATLTLSAATAYPSGRADVTGMPFATAATTPFSFRSNNITDNDAFGTGYVTSSTILLGKAVGTVGDNGWHLVATYETT